MFDFIRPCAPVLKVLVIMISLNPKRVKTSGVVTRVEGLRGQNFPRTKLVSSEKQKMDIRMGW